jgi:hypothetical protein
MVTQTPKIFAQQYPAAGIDTNLFTVVAGHNAQLSVFVANHNAVEDQISVSLVPQGTANTTPPNYIAYQTRIFGNGCIAFSGLFLDDGDQVRVTSANGTTSFVATGVDIIP